jgi:hypothetical protein
MGRAAVFVGRNKEGRRWYLCRSVVGDGGAGLKVEG